MERSFSPPPKANERLIMAAVLLRAGLHVSDCSSIMLSVLVASPWSLSCQRSCTPSHRTSWTGTNPTGSARRKRRRRGTASTRRPLTKNWRPRRSRCSQPKLSSCQRRYWKSNLQRKSGHLSLPVFPHFSVLWWILWPFFYFNFLEHSFDLFFLFSSSQK